MNAYVAKKSCGCVVAAHVDRPQYKNEVAKEVSRWIKEGYTVERVTQEFVRLNLKGCHCGESGNLFTQENV